MTLRSGFARRSYFIVHTGGGAIVSAGRLAGERIVQGAVPLRARGRVVAPQDPPFLVDDVPPAPQGEADVEAVALAGGAAEEEAGAAIPATGVAGTVVEQKFDAVRTASRTRDVVQPARRTDPWRGLREGLGEDGFRLPIHPRLAEPEAGVQRRAGDEDDDECDRGEVGVAAPLSNAVIRLPVGVAAPADQLYGRVLRTDPDEGCHEQDDAEAQRAAAVAGHTRAPGGTHDRQRGQ